MNDNGIGHFEKNTFLGSNPAALAGFVFSGPAGSKAYFEQNTFADYANAGLNLELSDGATASVRNNNFSGNSIGLAAIGFESGD